MRHILTTIIALSLAFSSLCQISGTEYYIDVDPGYGKATQISGAVSSDSFYNFVLPLTSYTAGFHKLGIRSKDNQGKWSLTSERVFYIVEDVVQDNIVSLQYYFTGAGSTDSVYTYIVPNPSQTINLDFNADLSQLEGNRTYTMHTIAISSTGSRSEEYTKTVKACNGDPAKAKFTYVVSGAHVSFINNSLGLSNTYVWSYGDRNTDTISNPFHDYDSAGVYPIRLIASNACNSDTAFDTVRIIGIRSIYTNVGGNTGSVTVDVKGAGFDSGIQIKLHKDGQQDIIGDTSVLQDEGLLTTTFDLTGKTSGLWDVIALFKNGKTDTLNNGFTVEATTETKLWVNITGDRVLRVGFNQVYTVTYGNMGNTDADFIPLFVSGLPLGTDIQILNPLFKLDALPGFDTLNLSSYKLNYTINDTILGISYREFYLGKIPAGSTQTLSFIFHLPSNVVLHSHPIIAVYLGNPIENQIIAVNKSILDNEDNPGLDCDNELFIKSVEITVAELAKADPTGILPCLYNTGSIGFDIYKAITSNSKKQSTFTTILDAADRGGAIAATISPCIRAGLNIGAFFQPEFVPAVAEIDEQLMLAEATANKIIPSHYQQVLDEVSQGLDIAKSLNGCAPFFKSIYYSYLYPIVGNAHDPNEKYGPGDSSVSHYIDSIPLPYVINFENDTSANLNAQTVTVTDTLKKDYYDFPSFGFTSVTIGNSVYLLTSPATSFVHDFDFIAQYGVKARVTATFDTSTGIAQWKFLTIDPVTNQATTNALSGFLPPDVNSPEGQGYVSFAVRQKPELQTGDSIFNAATIKFDYNPDIITNTWQNVFDFVPPASKMLPLPLETNDTNFIIQWNGADNLSGIEGYDIYVSVDDSAFHVWKSDVSAMLDTFTGRPGSTYRFYTLARDNAGNVEENKTAAEASITIKASGVLLTVKAFLQGPYAAGTGLMTDSLRVKRLLPTSEPYTALGFTAFDSSIGKSFPQSLLDSTGAKAITDWIWVELRSSADAKQILSSRPALIRRDGNVVDTDGTSPIRFDNVSAGNYYVAVRHRNHLGMMTAGLVSLQSNTSTLIDFTSPLTSTYGVNAQQNANGIMMMWAGDANGNSIVSYNGADNDKNSILSLVGLTTSNNIITAYSRADCNLDGKISYNGASNDKNKVLSTTGLTTPNNIITEQLPK